MKFVPDGPDIRERQHFARWKRKMDVEWKSKKSRLDYITRVRALGMGGYGYNDNYGMMGINPSNANKVMWTLQQAVHRIAPKDFSITAGMLKLPEALRQMIVNIWRAGIRDRGVERFRRQLHPLRLNLSHRDFIRRNQQFNEDGEPIRLLPLGQHAIDSNSRHLGNYAYGGNPGNRVVLEENNDYRTTTQDYGHTLTKLIRYILPRGSYNYKSDGTPQDPSAFDELGRPKYRGIASVRFVDRMI